MKRLFFLLTVILLSCSQPKVVYDIPPLIGKNIDEVVKIINEGKPYDFDTLYTSINKHFTHSKGSYILDISYNNSTRKINKFLIVSQDESFRNYKDILRIGNLDSISKKYYVKTDMSFSYFNTYSNITIYPK